MLGRTRHRRRFPPVHAPLSPRGRASATGRPSGPLRLPGGEPGAAPIVAVLEIARPEPAEPTRVVAVYPTTAEPPENLLRFYLHFSAADEPGPRLSPPPAPRRRGPPRRRSLPGAGRGALGPERDPVDPADRPRPDQAGPRPSRGTRPGPGGRRDVHPRGRRLLARRDRPAAGGSLPEDLPRRSRGRRAARPGSMGGPASPLRHGRPARRPLPRAARSRPARPAPERGRRRGRAGRRTGRGRGGGDPLDLQTLRRPGLPDRTACIVGTDLEDLAGNAVGRPFEVDVFDRVEPRVEARSVTVPFRVE